MDYLLSRRGWPGWWNMLHNYQTGTNDRRKIEKERSVGYFGDRKMWYVSYQEFNTAYYIQKFV